MSFKDATTRFEQSNTNHYPKNINVVPLDHPKDIAEPCPTCIDSVIAEQRDLEDNDRPPLTAFEQELRKFINSAHMENASNTPDFILAEYLNTCLKAFNVATRRRESWYGRKVF